MKGLSIERKINSISLLKSISVDKNEDNEQKAAKKALLSIVARILAKRHIDADTWTEFVSAAMKKRLFLHSKMFPDLMWESIIRMRRLLQAFLWGSKINDVHWDRVGYRQTRTKYDISIHNVMVFISPKCFSENIDDYQ